MSDTEDVKHLCDKWFEEFGKYITTAVKWFKHVYSPSLPRQKTPTYTEKTGKNKDCYFKH